MDTILWCTGYHYAVPFLKGSGAVQTERGRISPCTSTCSIQFGPKLSFVGLGFRSSLPLLEIQTRWVAGPVWEVFPPDGAGDGRGGRAFYGGIEGEGARVGCY